MMAYPTCIFLQNMINEVYITTSNKIPHKPFVQMVQEVCVKTDPKPLFCEFPEDLKLKSISNSGTAQTYTYTSLASPSIGFDTSSTTTT